MCDGVDDGHSHRRQRILGMLLAHEIADACPFAHICHDEALSYPDLFCESAACCLAHKCIRHLSARITREKDFSAGQQALWLAAKEQETAHGWAKLAVLFREAAAAIKQLECGFFPAMAQRRFGQE